MAVRTDQDALLIAAQEVASGNVRIDKEALLIATQVVAAAGNVRVDQLFVSLLVPTGAGSGASPSR